MPPSSTWDINREDGVKGRGFFTHVAGSMRQTPGAKATDILGGGGNIIQTETFFIQETVTCFILSVTSVTVVFVHCCSCLSFFRWIIYVFFLMLHC